MIPVFDISRQSNLLNKGLNRAISETIGKGIFILGEKVAGFEREFAQYLGVKYAVGVASGTDALSLSLLAIGVGVGDEVIMPANSYPTAFAVTAIGAIPRLVDIDTNTFNIDPAKIVQAINQKTKVIIAVHLYGQPADLNSIRQIIKQRSEKIYLVEDCAQAHGAEINLNYNLASSAAYACLRRQSPQDPLQFPRDFAAYHPGHSRLQGGDRFGKPPIASPANWKKVGSIGDIGCFSFYPTKNLGCFGDGGMVVTNNKDIYEKVKLLRMYGERKRYESVLLGRNSRLDELQAAILLVKFKYLDQWNKKRREIADCYNYNLQVLPSGSPMSTHNVKHVYHLYVIKAKKRNELKKYLEEKGIGTAIHYPRPIHLVPSFAYLGHKEGDFPESERASREILSLPIYPELTDKEIEKVSKTINDFYRR